MPAQCQVTSLVTACATYVLSLDKYSALDLPTEMKQSTRGTRRTVDMLEDICRFENEMSIPVTERLRDSTRAMHTEVERAGVMRLLLHGQLGQVGYCRLLRNLHAIYVALEAGLSQNASKTVLAALRCEPLFRSDALGDDLNFLHGADWAEAIPLTVAAMQYADHLNALATRKPLMLGAHAYVRYLGDLSGGQMLARIVAKSLALEADQGVNFYDFGGAENVAKHARAFRAGLDILADDETNAQALVEEAGDAFSRHRMLFEELVYI